MVQRTVVIASKVGLHARPAALFSKAEAAGNGAEQALDQLVAHLAQDLDA